MAALVSGKHCDDVLCPEGQLTTKPEIQILGDQARLIPPASPLSSGGNNGSINLIAGTANGVNNARIGSFVYLSPEQFFYANATTLYVADSGQPKNGNINKAALGEGGLQKWSLVSGSWVLDFDLVAAPNLVNNANANSATPTAPGVTGVSSD